MQNLGRNIFCVVGLIAFIYFARKWLTDAFEVLGFGSGMAICAGGLLVLGTIAFGWDYFEKRRSQS